MADVLTKLYDDWNSKQNNPPTEFQIFQAAFSLAAVSMRKRAMDACGTDPKLNDIKNKIGQLSDIPVD